MKKNQIYLLNIFNGNRAWETDVYNRVKNILTQNGINVNCLKKLNPDYLQFGDIIISHQPQIAHYQPGIFTFCEPKQILSRSSRLKFLDENGFPTMHWIDGKNFDSVKELFNQWNTNKILFKKNKSFQSNGVKIINRNDEVSNVQKGDVFCKIIN